MWTEAFIVSATAQHNDPQPHILAAATTEVRSAGRPVRRRSTPQTSLPRRLKWPLLAISAPKQMRRTYRIIRPFLLLVPTSRLYLLYPFLAY